MQLDAIPKGALVTLLMRDIMRVPYLISSEVLQDRSPMSVNLEIPPNQVPERVVKFLRSIGLSVGIDGGTVFVSGSGARGGPYPSMLPGQISPGTQLLPGQTGGGDGGFAPRAPAAPAFSPKSIAVLRPVHRSPSELAEFVREAFPTLVITARSSVAPDMSEENVTPAAAPDSLVMSGAPDLLNSALELVTVLDTPRPLVSLKVLVLELRSDNRRGSALQVLSDAVSASVRPESYPALPVGPQALSVSLLGVTVVASAVREDGRFRIMAEPVVMVESGSPAMLNAGAEVPTLGAVTLTENGQSFRSVEYRSSGLILAVTPSVIGDRIHLQVKQERSSFSATTTGVDDSPTLDQTALSTSLTLKDGETVTLAGVTEATDSDTKRGIFGGLLRAKQTSETGREIIIVIEASVIEVEQAEKAVAKVIGPFDAPSTSSSLNLNGGAS